MTTVGFPDGFLEGIDDGKVVKVMMCVEFWLIFPSDSLVV